MSGHPEAVGVAHNVTFQRKTNKPDPRVGVSSAEEVQRELAKAESTDDFLGKDGIFARHSANMLGQMLEVKPIEQLGEELAHCLEGEIEYRVADQVYRLEAGDSLLLETTQPFAYHNVSQVPAIVPVIFQAARVHDLARQHH
jgi:hypothetical protein